MAFESMKIISIAEETKKYDSSEKLFKRLFLIFGIVFIGNAIHHSHTILGQVALRLGDIDGNG
jgi:hypothetical protein